MARGKLPVSAPPVERPLVRCAIYTRKSTDENLDNGFNSLDAQREAAENYIRSQQSEGWTALPQHYDDGAYSGATLERPALQRLLGDVRAGRIDAIIVYKIDRLSRSLMDFTRLVGELERHSVSMVSVTQQFNTTTSMGRLTLNILMSFSEFEREVIAERIRDKIAAEKRRGRWVGGVPPFGYDVDRTNRRLMVNPVEAVVVRQIFRRFLQLRSSMLLARELNRDGHTTKAWTTQKGKVMTGRPWDNSNIYRVLTNPAYIGLIRHKEKTFPGEHEAIIEQPLWDEAQKVFGQSNKVRGNATRSRTPAILRGLVRCGCCGTNMGITFANKGERRYRYYLCLRARKRGYDACPVKAVPAGDIEQAVMLQLRRIFRSPEILAGTTRAVLAREADEVARLNTEKAEAERELAVVKASAGHLVQAASNGGSFVGEELIRLDVQKVNLEQRIRDVEAQLRYYAGNPPTPEAVADELARLDNIWEALVPAEQERIVQLLVEQVLVHPDRLEVSLRVDGLYSLVTEMQPEPEENGDAK